MNINVDAVKDFLAAAGFSPDQLVAGRKFITDNLTCDERGALLDFLREWLTRVAARHGELPNHDPPNCTFCGMAEGINNVEAQKRIREWLSEPGSQPS